MFLCTPRTPANTRQSRCQRLQFNLQKGNSTQEESTVTFQSHRSRAKHLKVIICNLLNLNLNFIATISAMILRNYIQQIDRSKTASLSVNHCRPPQSIGLTSWSSKHRLAATWIGIFPWAVQPNRKKSGQKGLSLAYSTRKLLILKTNCTLMQCQRNCIRRCASKKYTVWRSER